MYSSVVNFTNHFAGNGNLRKHCPEFSLENSKETYAIHWFVVTKIAYKGNTLEIDWIHVLVKSKNLENA